MVISNKYVLALIRAHYENDEEAFKRTCRELASELAQANDNGSVQLSHYISGMIGDEPTFVPMEND